MSQQKPDPARARPRRATAQSKVTSAKTPKPQEQLLARPAPDDREGWKSYWKERQQLWRTEPEIDARRQEELAKRRTIVPDIEKGIYSFRGIKLNRADIEWLLATHENGRGPVDWSDESQRERVGLDLCGADVRKVDLRRLPLAGLICGIHGGEWGLETKEQCEMAMLLANEANLSEAQLQGANLSEAQLQGANLLGAQLQNANLLGAQLQNANLLNAQLQNANLFTTQLQGAFLIGVQMQDANLSHAQLQRTFFSTRIERGYIESEPGVSGLEIAQLQRASFRDANLKGASLTRAQLQGADFTGAQLQRAYLVEAQLQGANLTAAQLQGANLADIVLGDENGIGPQLVDAQWSNTNLVVVDWSQVKRLGDEHRARQKRYQSWDGKWKIKMEDERLREYRDAVRANRQLSIALQAQGLNEDACNWTEFLAVEPTFRRKSCPTFCM